MDGKTELRERIIRHAGPKFFAQGFRRITTDDLARELGISKKTLYREFSSKEQIVREVVHRTLAEVDERLRHTFDDETKSFLERLGAQLEVASHIIKTLSTPFLEDLSRNAPDLWQEIQEFRQRRVFSKMESLIRGGQQEGVIRQDVDPPLIVRLIVTVADNLLVPETMIRLDLHPQEVIRHMGLLVSEGLLTRSGRAQMAALGIIDEKGEERDE